LGYFLLLTVKSLKAVAIPLASELNSLLKESQSVRKRIAESILRLFRKENEVTNCINVSRDDLAALSGTASETVSRTLTEFKNEGLIEKKGSLLKILNHDRISAMRN